MKDLQASTSRALKGRFSLAWFKKKCKYVLKVRAVALPHHVLHLSEDLSPAPEGTAGRMLMKGSRLSTEKERRQMTRSRYQMSQDST